MGGSEGHVHRYRPCMGAHTRIYRIERFNTYNICVCLIGGLLIGLWQRKYGILPDDMEQVMGKVKATGGYPYNNLPVIAVAALLPLIFGGALGPEAGFIRSYSRFMLLRGR